jgi:hypothetical protein
MKNNSFKNLVLGFALGSFGLVTLAVNIPHSFKAGDPISAVQMNENFSVLKGAVDALESGKQNRVSAKCDDGSAIKQINEDGSVLCETDDVGSGGAGYTAGLGLKLTGTQFSADLAALQARVSESCPVGSSIREIGGNGKVTCEKDDEGVGDITKVIAGPGLAGGADSGEAILNLANDGVTTPKIADNAVTRLKINDGAVNAAKISDEPGVAQELRTTQRFLDSSVIAVVSASIDVPAAGYVLAMASAEAIFDHTNAIESGIEFGVSDSPNAFGSDQDKDLQIPANASTGTHEKSAAAQKIFPVNSAGTKTFYILARETSGVTSLNDATLSLVYFPTSYGTVAQ